MNRADVYIVEITRLPNTEDVDVWIECKLPVRIRVRVANGLLVDDTHPAIRVGKDILLKLLERTKEWLQAEVKREGLS